MVRRSILPIFVVAAACNPNVIVELTGLPAEVTALRIDASLDGSPFPTIEKPRLDRFVLELPSGTNGALEVSVSGIGLNGCTVSKGVARADAVRSAQYYATSLTIPNQAIPPSYCRCGQSSFRFQKISNSATQIDPGQVYGGVWGTSTQSVTFFGTGGSLLQYSGASNWSFLAGAPGSNIFLDGHGDTAGNLWGADSSASLYHFDGKSWRSERTSAGANSVWAGAPNNVWTGGDKCQVQRFDGQVWKTIATPATCTAANRSINRVWGIGDTVWAFGDRNSSSGFVMSCTTSGCSEQTLSTNVALSSAWGDSLNNFWAVSSMGAIFRFNPTTQVWQSVQKPPSAGLLDVWGSGPEDVWAVGLLGTILHFDGSAWAVHGQSGSFGNANMESIWGYGCELFAGGASSTVLRYTTP
jgi:hypothetical protein